MAETLTNTNGSIILKQNVGFIRPFYFGTVSQTVAVSLSKNGLGWAAAIGPVAEVGGAGNGKGWYTVTLAAADTNTIGVLAYDATAASGGPVDFCDIVQAQIFTDLALDVTGSVSINSSYKKNQPTTLPFVMTVGSPPLPTPGLAPTGQRNFGAGFSPIGGPITDLGSGCYSASLLAADTNAAVGIFRFSSATPNANDQDITLYFQP
jgi:hypothetical protein